MRIYRSPAQFFDLGFTKHSQKPSTDILPVWCHHTTPGRGRIKALELFWGVVVSSSRRRGAVANGWKRLHHIRHKAAHALLRGAPCRRCRLRYSLGCMHSGYRRPDIRTGGRLVEEGCVSLRCQGFAVNLVHFVASSHFRVNALLARPRPCLDV